MMDLNGKVAVVTGAAQGIGLALVHTLKSRGAIVAATDLRVSDEMQSAADLAFTCNVGDQSAVESMIARVENDLGPIALMCSNAGILTGLDLMFENAARDDTETWNTAWAVNVMAHVHAARVLVPLMKSRGGGAFLHTASAAGLLSQIGSAIYSTTKHAAVGFAESLAIVHRDDGIRVSVLCPQGVDTPMIHGHGENPATHDGILPASDVADFAIKAVEEGRFLVLPHDTVKGYIAAKAENTDKWIGGMAKLQRMMKPS